MENKHYVLIWGKIVFVLIMFICGFMYMPIDVHAENISQIVNWDLKNEKSVAYKMSYGQYDDGKALPDIKKKLL